MRPVNRIVPKLPVAAFRTYGIAAPPSTHWRPAGCAEVDCPAHANGWTTTVDERTELGARQAAYIRVKAGRAFRECRDEAGLTVFTFLAGQSCFASHRKRLDRPELYVVRDGDWRGNPTGWSRRHSGPDPWLDDFQSHQEQLTRRKV